MRELRTVLIGASPLLADLIRRAASARLRQAGVKLEIVADLADLAELGSRLAELAPDLVILCGASEGPAPTVCRATATLALSSDLSLIFGPGEDDVSPLTPKTLATRIIELATTMGFLSS